jgi:hypothetical protein
LRILALCLALCVFASPVSAKTKPKPKRAVPSAPELSYVSALAVANHFLRAWQTGDIETGIMLMSDTARHQCSEDRLRDYFAAPMQRGFEIGRGSKVRTGRYSFAIAMVEETEDHRIRRKASTIVITSTGKQDRTVDTLP